MDNNKDLAFTSKELAEMFGIDEPNKVEKENTVKTKVDGMEPVATKTAEPKTEKKSLVVTSKLTEMGVKQEEEKAEDDYEIDDLIKRADKIKKELEQEAAQTAAAVQERAQSGTTIEIDYKDEKNIAELAAIFDELRKIIEEELTVACGDRAARAMLLKTLEKTAFGNFVFKNTNWDSDGKLREDGMIDMERLVKNIKMLGPSVRLKIEIEEGLTGLLFSRLKAVRLGLGKDKYEAIKNKITKRIHVIEAGYNREITDTMKNNIIAPAFKKGDEEI